MSELRFENVDERCAMPIFEKGRRVGAIEAYNEVRRLMKPLPSNTKKEDLWIAGSYKDSEEFVLVNLRQKVLNKIDKLDKELKGKE